ncbi:TPA: hypothetical protein ACPVZW_004620 [Vibrio parahaemolyticus]|uniref:hypothetical protein n=1 Tax=Vibrio vulnificus TaxID=672 RepID=UPI0019D499C7|nr:hypothetical protein [Vibrio vulnificus]HCG5527103.1 hypothetical protein [Vibrio parahaemolyticus]MBN8086233.1 hypothetical protein [Vibrio vulnificus]MBN8129283.1 hypothetical protein [Vibrio vulnificus]MBN8133736.1 hypothetical protein [Vibrio vulnificus]MBN8138536.1 hypothetical protein [Vibrio vulnificus]
MDDKTERIINRVEELFIDTVNMDIEIVKDRLSYITWLTALAAAAVTFSIAQLSTTAKAIPQFLGINLDVISVLLLFLAIVIGVVAKYQGHQSLYYHRMMIAMAKMQRYPFYRKVLEEDPISFGRKYHLCEYLGAEKKQKFNEYKALGKRWYSEENLLYVQAISFVFGYALVAFMLLGK